jgi:hypothetical protein
MHQEAMPARPPLTLEWNACDRVQWDHLLGRAGKSSVEQSWVYGAAMSACHDQIVDRLIIKDGEKPVAMAQLYRRRLMNIASLSRVARGPLLLVADGADGLVPEIFRTFREAFSLRRREILFWLPELLDTPENQTLMRSIGTRRMVTGLSSGWLDLSLDEDALLKGMSGSWRNALRMAEKNGSGIIITDNAAAPAADLAFYDAFRKKKRFVGPSTDFVGAIAEAGKTGGDVLILSATMGKACIAGIVLVTHGASATYFVSWTSEKGREFNAHNLLLWRGIQELKAAGARWLDLGGLNTGPGAGVARFKLGLGANVFTLAGTFL